MMKTKLPTFNSGLRLSLAVSLLGGAILSLGACTEKVPELHKETNVELIQDMMVSPAIKAQDFDYYDTTKPGSRTPPEHTVPVGYEPYPYHLNPDAAVKNLKNPVAVTEESLRIGQTKFETYCAVCHGYTGMSDTPVAGKMALKPPMLAMGNSVGFPDAMIYHIVTDGRGVMSSYAYQLVNANDRWAIVNYVRTLQKKVK